MEKETAGKIILRWWPIIAFAVLYSLTALGGFYSLQSAVVQNRIERQGQIERLQLEITAHEKAQAEERRAQQDERAELMKRLDRIELLIWDLKKK